MTHRSLVGIFLCFVEIYVMSPSSGLKNRASKLLCLLIAGLFWFLCDPEDGGFPWKRSVVVPDYMVSHPRSFLSLVLCEPNKSFCSRAVCCFFPYLVSQFCSSIQVLSHQFYCCRYVYKESIVFIEENTWQILTWEYVFGSSATKHFFRFLYAILSLFTTHIQMMDKTLYLYL